MIIFRQNKICLSCFNHYYCIFFIYLEMAPKNKIDESEKKPLIGRVGTNLRVGIVSSIEINNKCSMK